VRISYSSLGLVGVPLTGGTSLGCGPQGPLAGGVGASYRNSYLVDVGARRAVRLIGRAQCTAQSAAISAGSRRS